MVGRGSRRAPARAGRGAPAVLVALIALVAASLTVLSPAPASAAFSTPGFVRAIGGRGEAGVYAWGVQYNPVTGETLVSDYWNFQVRRYDSSGAEVGSFYRSAADRKGQPYSLGVDPRDGSIYVPEISDGKARGYIAKYDRTGNYLFEINTGARYNAWITVDKDGYLYVADSAYWNNAQSPPKIRKYAVNDGSRSASQIANWGSFGGGPGQLGIIHGLDTDNAGYLYVDDATNRVVHKYTTSGSWVQDFGSAGNAVGQFTGDLRGLSVDAANGWVYVVDAEAAQIEKFTTAGVPLLHWGSEGSGSGQMADGGRQVDVDGAGNVVVADYGNYRVLKFDPNGALISTYPNPASPPPPGGMAQVRDVAVNRATGAVWVADSWNNRFQEFGPDGAFIATYGNRNSHPPYGMDYPRGIAVDPATGNIWVANTRDHVIRVYDSSVNYLFDIGAIDSTSSGNLRWPMDIQIVNGKAWVADYTSGLVKRFDAASGAQELAISHPNNGLAIDPASGNVFIVDYTNDRVYGYTSNGGYFGSFGTRGTGVGQFENPWDIDVINGSLYVTDAQLNKVEVFTLNGSFIGEWGTAGTKPGQFHNPSGIDHDAAGNIYIADAGNDRIQEFSPTPLPGGDTTAPTSSLSSPAPNQELPAQTVWASGTATDNAGVAIVETAIRDRDTSLWWDSSLAVWTTGKKWNLSQVSGSDPHSVQWRSSFNGPRYSGRYSVQARATDSSGLVGTPTSTVNFTVAPS